MDELDNKIIKFLKEDASISLSEIADRLKVPQPTVYVRVNKLRRDGVIKKFTILLESEEGNMQTAIIYLKDYLISKMTRRNADRVKNKLVSRPNVVLVVELEELKLLVGWKESIDLGAIDGIEKIIPTKTISFTG